MMFEVLTVVIAFCDVMPRIVGTYIDVSHQPGASHLRRHPTKHSVIFGEFHSKFAQKSAYVVMQVCDANENWYGSSSFWSRSSLSDFTRKLHMVAVCLFCVCRLTD